jgi:hypothetical protein
VESNKQKVVSKSGKNDLKPFHEKVKRRQKKRKKYDDVVM